MPAVRAARTGVRGTSGTGDLRQGNLTQVLRYVRDHGSSSRYDIAQACGLGISTMTELISELKSRRLVKELPPVRRPSAGRPTRPIALDGDPWCALGMHVDVDQVRVHAATLGGRELWSDHIGVDLRGIGQAGREVLGRLVDDQVRRVPPGCTLLAVEVAVPGYVTRDTGTVGWSAGLGWRDFPLAEVISDAVHGAGLHGLHIGIGNDCHLAGLYAARVELQLPLEAVSVYLGGVRGVSGCAIIGGQIFRGANGGAGDFAHTTIDPDGAVCWCGRRGCLQTVVGLEALVGCSGLAGPEEAHHLVDHRPRQAVSALRAAADRGHSGVLTALRTAGAALGASVDDLIGIFNPHTVVLGGYLGVLGPYLMPALQQRISHRTAISAFAATNVVALESLAPRAVLGATLAARDACLDDPLHLTWVTPA